MGINYLELPLRIFLRISLPKEINSYFCNKKKRNAKKHNDNDDVERL